MKQKTNVQKIEPTDIKFSSLKFDQMRIINKQVFYNNVRKYHYGLEVKVFKHRMTM